MIKQWDIIKHKKFKDVACQVIEPRTIKGVQCALVQWVNLGQTYSWMIDTEQQLITLDNPEDWMVCLEPEKKCLRDAEWKDIINE